jgi:signal transduction histidine kinase
VALLERPDAQEIQAGAALLNQYGYTGKTPLSQAPLIRTGMGSVFLFGSLLVFLFALLIFFVFSRYARFIYNKIDGISRSAEKIVDGDYDLHLEWEGEGSFAILGHHFNQMTDRLKSSMESLKAEKTFLRDIIADISHQLKTPLSTLILNHEILLSHTDMDEPTRRTFLESGSQQLNRLEWLIQSLLKMARLESGSIIFKKESQPVMAVVREAYDTLSMMAEKAGVQLMAMEAQPTVHWWGDREWLREALINIIKNCIEHCKPGGTIKAQAFNTPLTSGVIITDNGEGIAEEELPHIFKRFYKGSNPKPTSIGIGLSLSKAIVEGHGGSIIVRSKKGVGSEFVVLLFKEI